MVAPMKSAGVLTVRQCRLRTRPRITLVGATISLWSLSHKIGCCLSVMLGSLSRMKTASMLAAIAC